MDKNTEQLFIYHLTLTPYYKNPKNWTEATFQMIQEHATFLDNLGKQGILAFAGRTNLAFEDENLFGIAIIKANTLEQAKAILKNDPAVLNGIQQANIFPFWMGIRHLNNL